jgi:hypothetical protein
VSEKEVAPRVFRPPPHPHKYIYFSLTLSSYLFSVVLHRPGDAALARLRQRVVHIKRRPLVRVLPVPQGGRQGHRHGHGGRRGDGSGGRRCARSAPHLAPQPFRDRRVVAGRVRERLPRQAGPHGQAFLGIAPTATPQALQQGRVVGRVDDDGHGRVVFGGRPDHGGPADVDVFHAHLKGRGLGRIGHRLAEGVQVDDDDVDGGDAGARDGGHVGRVVSDGKNAAVDGRVERLDPAGQHFREAGQGVHPGDGQASGFQGGGGAARGDELVAEGGQALARDKEEGGVRGFVGGMDGDKTEGETARLPLSLSSASIPWPGRRCPACPRRR